MLSLQPFWFALQFLTRLPVPVSVAYGPEVAGRSLLAYPLVGLLLGALFWALAVLLSAAPAGVAAALLLLFWVLVTGALHLDGLADCADAWVGGHGSRERSFAILKDPHVGSVAVAVLVCVLLAKFSALQALVNQPAAGAALLLAPVAGRCAALALLSFAPYASPQGLASAWLEHFPLSLARISLGVWLLLLLWLLGAVAVAAAVALLLGVRALSMARLGGVTGDVCGAAVELTETTILLAMVWA